MASVTTLLSEQEYDSTTYIPPCDYSDGVLRPITMPAWKHARLQVRQGQLLDASGECASGSEFAVKIRTGKYVLPDLVVLRLDRIQEPYALEPVHLCIEVLSPDDRASEAFAKCEEYLEWGVEMTWVVDPE